jgi:hypothetical protein
MAMNDRDLSPKPISPATTENLPARRGFSLIQPAGMRLWSNSPYMHCHPQSGER